MKAQYDGTGGGRGGRGGRGRGGETDPNRLTAVQEAEKIDAMLLGEGALLRIKTMQRGEGIIVAQAHRAYDIAKTDSDGDPAHTTITGASRGLLEDGDDVKLAFNMVNHIYPGRQDQPQRGCGDSWDG